MAKNPGCWANVLDDCKGPLTAEHTLSVSIWAVPEGQPNNRDSRLRRQVTMIEPSGQSTTKSVRRMTRDILCEHHNNSTNDLDTEGGRFARALEQLSIIDGQRRKVMHPAAPRVAWNLRSLPVNGALLERWFMKTVINHAFGRSLPIGGDSAPPGWPTRELVEMVYGRRPVDHGAGSGLFVMAAVGDDVDIGERFVLQPYDRENRFIAGCLVSFRTLMFGLNFEPGRIPNGAFDKLLGLRDTQIVQPFHAMNFDVTNVEVRLHW